MTKVLRKSCGSEIWTAVSFVSTVFSVISYAPKCNLSPRSNAIRMRGGHDVWNCWLCTTFMSLRCNFLALADSRTAKCSVLCHLFRCFDPRFKENVLCLPAFVIRDINICRNSYSQGRLKSRKSYHCCKCYRIQISYKTTTNHSAIFVDIKRYNLCHYTWRSYRIKRR